MKNQKQKQERMVVTLNSGQELALKAVESGRNVFITGQGGVGKSELVKRIQGMFYEKGKCIAVTGLTGIAALTINGYTVHRWAGIGLGDDNIDVLFTKVSRNPNARRNWMNTHSLVIDEVSMLSPELFVKLDQLGRRIRRIDKPFGGIQLIFCGDFCQLGPVKINTYCFESPLWDTCKFQVCYLTENMRQSDAKFQKMLGEIRLGYASQETKTALKERIGAKVGTMDIQPTRLFSNRSSVDQLNKNELEKISTNSIHFEAIDTCNTSITAEQRKNYTGLLDKSCQGKKNLYLKVGAQVMLIANTAPDAGLVNGSRGVITGFKALTKTKSVPIVKFLNGVEDIVATHSWDYCINENTKMKRTQIPLILAWGSTIHKAQGLTIDCVEIDLGDTIFAPGQFYTALSRVKTLEGASITQLNFDKLLCDAKVREFYQNLDLDYGLSRIKLD
jgi:ATP-dependent DNA helicase PIF1